MLVSQSHRKAHGPDCRANGKLVFSFGCAASNSSCPLENNHNFATENSQKFHCDLICLAEINRKTDMNLNHGKTTGNNSPRPCEKSTARQSQVDRVDALRRAGCGPFQAHHPAQNTTSCAAPIAPGYADTIGVAPGGDPPRICGKLNGDVWGSLSPLPSFTYTLPYSPTYFSDAFPCLYISPAPATLAQI
jgi:hypothetical protein